MNRIIILRLAFQLGQAAGSMPDQPRLYGYDEAGFARPTLQVKIISQIMGMGMVTGCLPSPAGALPRKTVKTGETSKAYDGCMTNAPFR
jgi:hypothetical protein